MRQTHLFTKTRKEAPKDEVSKNAQLLIRAGYIHKEMAGVYSFLPLGLRVLNNASNIIRDEMNNIGGEEMHMTALQPKELWEQTKRWDADVWFKTALKNGTELGLGITHEEPMTAIMKDHLSSYRDLPRYPYQIQLKFRNEERAKSGLMRGREFYMKDLYSFSRSDEEHDIFYEKAKVAYMNIFTRAGIGEKTHITFASGGMFSKYSHEFQTESDAGEDNIYIDDASGLAVNEEVYADEVLGDLGLKKEALRQAKSIEVGNIFSLGTRFSDALNLTYKDEQGKEQKPVMGCYGIGPNRLMGTVAELLSDEKGLVWSKEVAPFSVHLVRLGEDESTVTEADALYELLNQKGFDVLYDDRDLSAGEKFASSDLIGIPLRVVVSPRTKEAGAFEVVWRENGAKENLNTDTLIRTLSTAFAQKHTPTHEKTT